MSNYEYELEVARGLYNKAMKAYRSCKKSLKDIDASIPDNEKTKKARETWRAIEYVYPTIDDCNSRLMDLCNAFSSICNMLDKSNDEEKDKFKKAYYQVGLISCQNCLGKLYHMYHCVDRAMSDLQYTKENAEDTLKGQSYI